MIGRIDAEWKRLNSVAVHKPGIEAFFGLLNPSAALYERPFSRYKARIEHEAMVESLKNDFGVTVKRLDETILRAADARKNIREELHGLAMKTIRFEGSGASVSAARSAFKAWENSYDSNHFLDIILLRPVIGAGAPRRRLPMRGYTKVAPLSNLYFMRDQQIVSHAGVFLGRMSLPQRRPEPGLTKILWDALGMPITGAAQAPATIEGGDFMPLGDFALIGRGSRTNQAGIEQFLSSGLSYDEVAAVDKPEHPLLPQGNSDRMIDMHLDTYFNVAGSNAVVGSSLLMKRANVTVYSKVSNGRYAIGKARQNLYEYIRSKGFDVIDISVIEQMSYASNFLCIKDGTILAADTRRNMPLVLMDLSAKAKSDPKTYGRLFRTAKNEYSMIKRGHRVFPDTASVRDSGIDFKSINVENLTGGYGGVHCMTAALSRS